MDVRFLFNMLTRKKQGARHKMRVAGAPRNEAVGKLRSRKLFGELVSFVVVILKSPCSKELGTAATLAART